MYAKHEYISKQNAKAQTKLIVSGKLGQGTRMLKLLKRFFNPLCAAYSNVRKNFGKFKLPLVANVYWGYNDRTRGQILENSACVIKIIAY